MNYRLKFWISMLIPFAIAAAYEFQRIGGEADKIVITLVVCLILGLCFGLIYAKASQKIHDHEVTLFGTDKERKDGYYTLIVSLSEVINGPLIAYIIIAVVIGIILKRKET